MTVFVTAGDSFARCVVHVSVAAAIVVLPVFKAYDEAPGTTKILDQVFSEITTERMVGNSCTAFSALSAKVGVYDDEDPREVSHCEGHRGPCK